MMARWVLLLPALGLLGPVRLCAQQETKLEDPLLVGSPAEKLSPPLIGSSAAGPANADRMYEDIEIFRRILDRKLEPCYPQLSLAGPNSGPGPLYLLNEGINRDSLWLDLGAPVLTTPNGGSYQLLTAPPNLNNYFYQLYRGDRPAPASHQEASRTLEGVYLPGQGVLYTATLSSLQPPARDQANDWEKGLKLGRPVSEWDNIRRQLRNEKEEPKKPETTKPPALIDVLLKALAENGHHFSQLGDKESLTLVLTVRGANPPAPAHQSKNETKKSSDARKRGEEGASFVDSKVRDLELLGDLHMKQEHYGQARDAFRKAFELAENPKQQAVLARKLAQAFLMLGNLEEARTALDQALKLTKEDGDKKDKPAPAAKPAAELPVKLILSAPKKLLDEVKEGKITFEEFRSRARVETLRFDARRSHK